MAKVSVVQNIANYFRNIALNAIGVERDLYQLLNDSDVSRAISLMDDNTLDVDNAIKEYSPIPLTFFSENDNFTCPKIDITYFYLRNLSPAQCCRTHKFNQRPVSLVFAS